MKNDYYVYLHRRMSDGVVFYVGKGNERSKRAYRKSRSKAWNETVQKAGGYTVEFYQQNLTENEALHIETTLITFPNPEWELVNLFKKCQIKNIPEYVSDYVYYDETSKSCLRWKCDIGLKIKKDTEVGSLNKQGYWSFELKSIAYMAHRVIMHLHGLLDENLIVNHIDNNRGNNKIENLEMVTFSENNLKSIHHNNNTVRPNNSSGVNGIHEATSRNKYKYAFVEWYDETGYKKGKRFSYLRHGKELAWELAIAFRKNKMEETYANNSTK